MAAYLRPGFLLLTLLVGARVQLAAQEPTPKQVSVNGAFLHYIERGHGEPVILLHGGVGDYTSWPAQMDAFSGRYRVISYSRRCNYPNLNPLPGARYTADVDAEDLLGLLQKLGLERVHLVGVSAGALTALVFAMNHPAKVLSLVLAEPPLHHWMRDVPDGKVLYEEFMTNIWKPASTAFRRGDTVQAMRLFVDGLSSAGKFDGLAEGARSAIMRNARAIEAFTQSSDPFPELSRSKIRTLRIPSLIVTGENTIRIHKRIDEELVRLLPNARAVVIPRAGHGSPRDNPAAFNAEVLGFLERISR